MLTLYTEQVPGYTQEEKLTIGRRHLLPKQLKAHGLPAAGSPEHKVAIEVGDDALKSMISHYTREAGVRDFDRKLGALCRAIALNVSN